MRLIVPPKPDGEPPRPSPRKPWLAGVLSFLWPGMGQVYCGRFRKGVVMLGLAAGWQLLGIGAVETFNWWLSSLAAAFLYSAWAAWDAARAARLLRDFLPGPRNSLQVYAACAVAMLTVSLVSGMAERWAFPVYTVAQTSMRPTLRSGDRIRCKALRPREVIRRGQLVVFQYPQEHSLIFVKRVVGLPGEVVEVDDGLVYVNGDPIDEGYYAERAPGGRTMDMPPARLAPDEYYVMGDNRHASFDSRSYGPVNRARMLAAPLYVIFSIDDEAGVLWDRTGLPAR